MLLAFVFSMVCDAYMANIWHFSSFVYPGPGLTLNTPSSITTKGTMTVGTNAQYATVASSLIVGGDLTFVSRIYVTSAVQWSRVFDFGNAQKDNVFVSLNANAVTLGAYTSTSATYLTCNGFKLNTWTVLTVTVTSGGWSTIYGDGVILCNGTTNALARVSRANQYIAKSNWATDPYIQGEIDFIWYRDRALSAAEVALSVLDFDMMVNAWTFQGPNKLGPNLALVGAPSLVNGYLNLAKNTSQYAVITPGANFGGPQSIAARVLVNSYQSWARIIEFTDSSVQNSVIVSASGSTDAGYFAVQNSGGQQTASCTGFFPLGSWVDLMATVSGTAFTMYKNGALACSGTGWEPITVSRPLQWIGKSDNAIDGGLDGSIEFVMKWPRALSASEAAYVTAGSTTRYPVYFERFSSASTLNGLTSLGSGTTVANGQLVLDQNADYALISSSLVLQNTMTITTLVYATSVQDYYRIFEFSTAAAGDTIIIGMGTSTSSDLRIGVGTGSSNPTSVTCSGFWTANTWIHLTVVFNGAVVTTYKNGVLFCTKTVATFNEVVRTKQYIGTSNFGDNYGFLGLIEHVAIWDRVLSASEVKGLANSLDKMHIQCMAPTFAIPRGNIGTCVDFGKIGTTCNLACNGAFVATVNTLGVCNLVMNTDYPVWTVSSSSLTCRAQCPNPASPQYGTVSCTGGTMEGATCTAGCSSGFTQSGSSTITCLANNVDGTGYWSASPTCTAVSCPAIVMTSGTAACSGPYGQYQFSSTCNFQCPVGFTMVGSSSTTCTSGGTWSNTPATCAAVQCPDITVSHLNPSYQAGPYGTKTYMSVVQFTCDTNFLFSGSPQLTCGSNGQWNATLPTCNVVKCTPPSQPLLGTASCDLGSYAVQYSATSVCTYTCQTGYQVSGSATQTCQSNGQWSSAVPTCVDIDECQTSTPCTGGAVCFNFVGGYSCSPGFVTPITSTVSGTNNLTSVLGERITFALTQGNNITILFSAINYTLVPGGANYRCASATYATAGNQYTINCTVGQGLGVPTLSVPYLTATGQVLTVTSTFRYPFPTIVSGTLRLYGRTPATSVFSEDYLNGDVISFNGTGFLPDPLLTVTYGAVGTSPAQRSTCILFPKNTTSTVITCRTKAMGTGSNMVFTVNANGQSVTGTDLFSIQDVPNVLSIVPISGGCVGDITNTSVFNCPTDGGALVLIIANYISANQLSGFIGGLLCSSISALTNDSSPIANYYFSCSLPSGTGFNRTVVVASSGKYSQPRNILSYAAPSITKITGCQTQSSSQVTQCARAGGDSLTLTGTNFGPSDAFVSIGGVRCASTTHNPITPNELVVCVTPPGYSLGRPVQLFQSAGPISQEIMLADYTQCNFGQYQNGTSTVCALCKAGTYTNSLGALTCAACDPGRFAKNDGEQGCQPCDSGTSQPGVGSSTCNQCNAGYYANSDAAVVCLPCDSGTSAPLPGAVTCTPCTPGSYSDRLSSAGVVNCTLCPQGYFSGAQQGVCQICPAGKFSNQTGQSVCQDCMRGYYQELPGSSECDACIPGMYSAVSGRSECLPCDSGTAANTSASTACTQCDVGEVSRRIISSPTGPDECVPCGPGQYMPSIGQAVCVACSPGTFSNLSGSVVCTLCDPGYQAPTSGSSSCVPCPLGTYTATSGRPDCTPCGSGYFSDSGAASVCVACYEGTYSDNANGVTGCSLCNPGSYINTRAQVSCLQCPVGYFAPDPGAVSCEPCPAGSATSNAGSQACSVCIPGRYSADPGRDSCTLCPAGTYAPYYNSTECWDCSEGSAQSATGASSCDDCEIGYYAVIPGREVCDPCPMGKFSDANSTSVCQDCSYGHYQSNPGASGCDVCERGTSNNIESASTCNVCLPGTFANTSASIQCMSCPAGYYQAYAAQTACDTCIPGKTSDKESSSCKPCLPGLVAPAAGTAICIQCGSLSTPRNDQSGCECQPGYFLDSNTSILCRPCPVGTQCTQIGTTRSTIPVENGYLLTDAGSLTYQKCLSPRYCMGGQCVGYRQGPLCGMCKPGYSMSDWSKSCSPCGSSSRATSSMAGAMFGLILAIIVLYVYIIYRGFNSSGLAEVNSSTAIGASVRLTRLETLRSKGHGQVDFNTGLGINVGAAPELRRTTTMSTIRSVTDNNAATIAAMKRRHRLTQDSYILKIMAYFFQVTTALISLPVAGALAFPTYYMQFLSYFKFFSLDFMPWQSASCLFHVSFYTKVVTLTLVPIVFIPFLGIVMVVVYFVFRYRGYEGEIRRPEVWHMLFLRAAIFTLFMLFPSVSKTVLAHFVCTEIGTGPTAQYLLTADFSVVCYSAEWRKWTPFIGTMIFVYPIGVPLFFFVLLYRNRNRLYSEFATLGLGFLHESYYENVWWFEVLVMVQKLLMTSLIQFLPLQLQLPGGVVLCCLYLLTIVLLQPEARRRNWILHLLANVQILLLLLLWHFSYKEGVTTAPIAIDGIASALFIALTVSLILMLLIDLLGWAVKRLKELPFCPNVKARKLATTSDDLTQQAKASIDSDAQRAKASVDSEVRNSSTVSN